ncbi:MAG: hypothetical protein ACI9IA_001009 [Enterobacterales bacterium]|jgi:hypothetical protein
MHKSKLLFESLPIARMGVRKDTEEVVIANDFSCVAQMLEEYISFGAVDIYMPSSSPEVSTLNDMPELLRKRIKIVEDKNEIEGMRRLLHGLRTELLVKISDDDQRLTFPKDTPRKIRNGVEYAHSIVRKLAIGFNYGIQVDINPEQAAKHFRYLREISSDMQTRVILAQLESLMGLYEGVNFDAPTPPKESAPKELITVFDRLINDQRYLEYSDSVAQLAEPPTREKALVKIRELERGVRSTSFISTGWNYAAKIIKVWSGVPIPESSAISSLIQGRNFPALIDLQDARSNAVSMWKKTGLVDSPLRRDGSPLEAGEIKWLPPLNSMTVNSPDDKATSFGKVSELLEALKIVSSEFPENDHKKV